MSAWTTGPIQNGQTTIGTTAAALSSSTAPFNQNVMIKAASTNTGAVYVGASGVTTSTGFPLAAGQSVTVGAVSPSVCYVIGSASGQAVAWIGS